MARQTESQGVGQQYSTHIEELREFFTSRQVRFGAPGDLNAFAEQVTERGPLEEEMGSMVRTILYQEEHLGRNKLLELVTIAVGGPEALSGAPELQGAVRQIFLFLNAALRQTRASFVQEEEEEETAAPAASLLVSQEAEQGAQQAKTQAGMQATWPQPETVARPSMQATGIPQDSLPQDVMPQNSIPPNSMAPNAMRPGRPARPIQGNEVLYRAMSLSAEEPFPPTPAPGTPVWQGQHSQEKDSQGKDLRGGEKPASKVPWWVIPAVGLGLAALGAGVYLGRPFSSGVAPGTAASAGKAGVGEASGGEAGAPSSCAPPTVAGVTRSGLEERSLWAHNLLEQRLYEVALPELREIARLDPGYPGVKLDESDALLHLKRPEEARDAVDAQIATSACLAKLPTAALDAYCQAQYASAAVSGCRPQLTHIRQAAELQAALVHLELGHQVQPDGAAAAAMAELTGESETPVKPQRARATPAHKRRRR